MARPFTSKDAENLIAQHESIRELMVKSLQLPDSFRAQAKNAADALVAREVLRVLRGVPVEELNRDKRGIRVKSLRDYGFATVGDLAAATPAQIASVDGVSPDGAMLIKYQVNQMVAGARADMKIRLSADDKNDAASQLVKSLYACLRIRPFAQELAHLETQSRFWLPLAKEAITPVMGTFQWMFAGKAKKEAATEAYHRLERELAGEYGQRFHALMPGIEAINRMVAPEAWQEFEKNPIPFFNLLEDIAPGVLGTDDGLYGLPEDLAREIENETFYPEGLLCDLRRYQQWGVKFILHQERVLLGDEMGLGKTIQAIAAMVSLANTGATHFVVVCPAGVLSNWCREVSSKSRLRVTKVHGAGRLAAWESWRQSGGVAVTTYEMAGFLRLPEEARFSLLTVDEAHYIKNPEARRTENVRRLAAHADRVLFMTGTALENRVSEMIALIGMLRPDIAAQVTGMEYLAAAPQFRKLVAPVYYRRKREDVLTELPELMEELEWCTLSPEEERVYEASVLARNYMDIRRVSWNAPDPSRSAKAVRLLEILQEAAENGRRIIVFSFFLETLKTLMTLLGPAAYGPISGCVSPARRQQIIDDFSRAPAGAVLVSQVQSGGTGLNIQAASVVVFCEPQLKPSTETQALSRAYRMGQTRNVLVFRLLADDTVDERILEMLDEKQKLFDAFADESEAAMSTLAIDDRNFGDIVQAEIDRINEKNGNA